MLKLFAAFILLHSCGCIDANFLPRENGEHRNALEKQEFLLNSLDEFDIAYPTEMDHRGQVTDHVTTLSNHRRRRRSTNGEPGPIIYQVKYKGKTIKMMLKVNDKLFGSDFTIEWHRENGTIDRKTSVDNCYLVGETEPFQTSVAISDCDGLAGIIDLGEDSIYIEPVLNTSLVIHRGWTGPGRPHLLYSKAALHRSAPHSLEFDEVRMNDFSKGLKVEEEARTADYAPAESSYITFINSAKRNVRLYYIEGRKETMFTVLSVRETQQVDTFTSHKWVVRDGDTRKLLFINKKRSYSPPTGNSMRKRSMAYITVPRGMKLPAERETNKPNSHLLFVNRSPRFVKLYYVEGGETIFFFNLAPGEEISVTTYTSHRWFVKDLDTKNVLNVNGQKKYIPVEATADQQIRVYITVPSTMRLADMTFPPMMKTKPKYIEVAATADSSVVLFHGKEKAEKYILTLMNIVSRIFQHKSIGAPIYFVVVRVILLEKDPKEVKITDKPMSSLTSVCYWGHKMRKGFDRVTKDFYDQTVFLTKKDFGPSGYAPVHGMCYRMRSCTLNQEDGFTSSFIIAHETGHTLGMEHDGVNNNCSNDVIKGSIMAPLVRSRFDRFYWSSCSRRDLISKLNSLWCLDDIPFRNKIPYLDKLPGQVFTVDEQCQNHFGRSSRFCNSMKRNPCEELWCSRMSFSGYNNRYCQTRRIAALEGTKCGDSKWCRLGKCVPVNNNKTFEIPLARPTEKPIHGGWSIWSDLSECSRSCGVGVQHKDRKCNNPIPKDGGSQCQGVDIKYELCNTMDCPGQLMTFEQTRNEQCKRLAPSVLPESIGAWSSYDIYKANIDCDFETDFCGWTNDRFDNYDWKRHKGRTPTSGTGPSTDHTIGKEGHYIFLETSRPISPGWRARLVSKYIGMRISCLKFWYHAFGGNVHMGDLQLVVKTELEEKVVWNVNQNRGDRWVLKYATIFSKKPYRIIFQGVRGDGYLSDFALDDIALLGGPCGIGQTKVKFLNNEMALNPCGQFCELTKEGKSTDSLEVKLENGTRCYNSLSSFDVCIQGKCQVIGCDGVMGSNKTLDRCGVCGGDSKSCSEAIGTINTVPKEDLQTLMECPVGATNIMLEDSSPNFLALSVMGSEQPYFNGADEKSLTTMYEFAGTKFMYKRDGDKESISTLGPIKDRVVVKVKMSKESVPITLRYQFYKPRDNGTQYYWSHFKWSDCSKTCGEGIKTRFFKCRKREDGSEAAEHNCFTSNKPEPFTKSCNLTACERYAWKFSEWTNCSVPCGGGNQTRRVECRGVLGGHLVKPSLCSSERPETKQTCNDEPCAVEWTVDEWSECSRTCGNGVKKREVTCLDSLGAKSSNCPRGKKPAGVMICRNERCNREGPVVFQNASCSFDKGFCQWTNVKDSKLEQFDWVLWNGSTPSRNTGPPNDHTLGTSKGVYAYIEASDPQQRNDRARLISPIIDARRICLDFWYHMYGANMGWLRVFLKSGNARERRLWHKSGNQGNEWINERLPIYSYIPYQVIIEGIRGKGFSSDAALDDIKVTSGGCVALDTPKNQCKGDKSRFCKAAVRLNWCSSKRWGHVCCKTCQKNA